MNEDDFTIMIDNRELEKWGVFPMNNDETAQLFLDYIGDGPPNCDFMGKYRLCLVFFYDRNEQPAKWKHYGGMCWKFEHETEQPLYAIGISKQTIERGKQKTVEMFLHECAHALHGVDHRAHDERFHDLLKVLVDEYNKANGTNYSSI